MKRLLRWSWLAARLLGLVLFVVIAGALLFEATGGLERVAQRALAQLFEDEPALSTDVRRVSIDWLTPAILIEGLQVEGAGGELYIEEARCVFDLSHGGGAAARIAALDLDRGRVVLSQSFAEVAGRALARAQATLEDQAKEPEEPLPGFEKPRRGLPVCSMNRVDFAVELPTGKRVELGSGGARLEDQGERGLSLAGTVALAGEGTSSQPLFFRAALDTGGQLQVQAATRNLRLKTRGSGLRELLPPALQQVDLDLRASIDLEGLLSIDGTKPPRTSARVRLEDGYLRPGPELPALEDLEIDGQVAWSSAKRPKSMLDLWRAIDGSGAFTAKLVGEPIEGAAQLPGGGQLVLALESAGVSLDERRLADLGLPEEGPVRSNWRAFDFTGRADVRMGLRLDLAREADPMRGLDLCLAASSAGQSSFRYNGFEVPGVGREGIPLACDQVEGRAVLGLRGGHPRPAILGIVDVHGSHGSGGFRSSGLIVSPNPAIKLPERPWAEELPDLDLVIEVDHRAIDDELGAALDGMTGTNWIFGTFQPAGGFCNAVAKLRSRPALGGMTALVDVDASDVDARWIELPVGLHVDDFELELRWSRAIGRDARGWDWRTSGGRFRARGSSASVQDLEVTGMVRGTSDAGPPELTGKQPMHFIRVSAPGLALRGSDWDELSASMPELSELGAELGTKGHVDLEWVDAALGAAGNRELAMQVTPTLVELLPAGFPMVTSQVAGRLCMSGRVPRIPPSADDDGAEGLYQAALAGHWAGGMRVAANLSKPMDEALKGRLTLIGAGLDPASSALLGAISSGGEASAETGSMNTEGLALDGRVDLAGELLLDQGPEPRAPELTVFLRDNTFRLDGLVLDRLQGAVTLADGSLSGPRVRARLAGSPVELTDAHFRFAPAARADTTFFRTELSAEQLPLDREHLAAFLEETALDALFEQFDWQGSVDLDHLDLELDREQDGRLIVRLAGHLVPAGLRLSFGAPVEVATAEIELEEFVLEGGRARSWGRVSGLFGTLAGREVRSGSLLFSYVDQRLTVQGLDSNFAGGELRSLGGGSATALAVDLAPPHHFSLGVEFKAVKASSLLEGAFGGSKQNRGLVDAAVRFESTPGEILASRGAGWIRIREARLWSIPVFRELFTQLGFDATGVFDSMRTNFAIQDGAFELRDMKAHSPLLKLVGSGRLDMNGDLSADLEVRYGLVDKLGPLRFLVYWFQNSILRVQVRGDLHRPLVLMRNFLLDIFKRDPSSEPRLPLPLPAPLPARF